MRPIKFRAWHKTLNIMGEVFQLDFEAKGVWVKFHNPDVDMDEADFWEFDDIILEQITPQSDKNGKEIYEGDVIQPSERKVCFGEFKTDFCQGTGFYTIAQAFGDGAMVGEDFEGLPFSFTSIQAEGCEVIGTIHDKENGV